MPWKNLLLIIATGGLLGTGCAGATAADLSAADHVFVTDGMAYTDAPTELSAGTLQLGLDNRDGPRHDITIEGIGTVAAAGGGGSAVGEVTLEPGAYTLYCDVSGHRQAGMELTLTVR